MLPPTTNNQPPTTGVFLHDYFLSLFLGIVEGLTEFLPVSSTAHLRICEAWLGIDLGSGYWKMFTIVIQLGAILTLPIYFRARLGNFLRTFPRGERGDKTVLTHPASLTAIAFVCTAIPAFLLTKVIGKNLESLLVMSLSLIIGGVVMWVVDAMYGAPVLVQAGSAAHASAARHGFGADAAASAGQAGAPVPTRSRAAVAYANTTDSVEDMSLGQAIWIGCCQLLSAVFPGTSRSMATISAGQTAGMTRASALEFSFLLSIPTMAAATLYELFKTLRHKAGATDIGRAPVNAHEWIVLAIGFIVSFVVAYAVVVWFMNWVRKRGFVPFAVYRILFGGLVLFLALRG